MRPLRVAIGGCAGLVAISIVALALRTRADLTPTPGSLDVALADSGWEARGVQVVDRHGEPLNVTFTNTWNVHDRAALHEIPEFLRTAFIVAEDKRFFEHRGVDWSARASALVTNVRNLRAIRGASTITEQVVRMLHPRPRSVWSRWLEGWEAGRLEQAFSKNEILEFYLNQVPYASNRRGVRQAASYYFARDVSTLSKKEMLALAVLVRAPTRFDLKRSTDASEGAIGRLAAALVERGLLSAAERDELIAAPLSLEEPRLAVNAPHFVQYARAALASSGSVASRAVTTLDARLQARVQGMLDERLSYLRAQQVANGAVLAVDHTSGEVLAWVVAGGGGADGPASHIDAVTTPRQPGSALKPFLYALALDSGWSAAEIIDDAPLTESTSGGLHSYENYSRRFYGPVTLRDALGNSLNIPALKTLQHVGAEAYLARLHELGFAGLEKHPAFYGDGIALGSGAVTLFELVQAYATLANRGELRPLSTLLHESGCASAAAAVLPGGRFADREHLGGCRCACARIRTRQRAHAAAADRREDRNIERLSRRVGRRLQLSLRGGSLDGQPRPNAFRRRYRLSRSSAAPARRAHRAHARTGDSPAVLEQGTHAPRRLRAAAADERRGGMCAARRMVPAGHVPGTSPGVGLLAPGAGDTHEPTDEWLANRVRSAASSRVADVRVSGQGRCADRQSAVDHRRSQLLERRSRVSLAR